MIDRDSDLQAQFKALKAQDARSIRPFSFYWEPSRRSLNIRRSLNLPAIATVLALLLIAVTLHFRFTRPPSIHPISRWRSPTASLLNNPGNALFASLPRIEYPRMRLLNPATLTRATPKEP